MAFRMQMSVPELVDLSDEDEATLELYGPDVRKPGSFAANCLLARRLAERGVRFIQLYHRGWDHHGSIKNGIVESCAYVDQATAALVQDLKQRGLFDSTLIVWGGEFGRTPLGENRVNFKKVTGRDHHPYSFSMWLAGGGVQGGQVIGETDEIGWGVAQDPVHVHDLHEPVVMCCRAAQTLAPPRPDWL